MRAEAERDRLVRQSVVRHPFFVLIRKSLFAKLTYCDMWHATFYAKILATSALLQPGQRLPDAHPERDDTLIMVVLIRPGLCRLFLAVSRCFTLQYCIKENSVMIYVVTLLLDDRPSSGRQFGYGPSLTAPATTWEPSTTPMHSRCRQLPRPRCPPSSQRLRTSDTALQWWWTAALHTSQYLSTPMSLCGAATSLWL